MPAKAVRSAAIEAVRQAATLCRAVQAELLGDSGSLTKGDRSPVTIADFGAQAIISLGLSRSLGTDRIVGEENADALRTEAGRAILDRVIHHVRAAYRPSSSAGVAGAAVAQLSETQVLEAIDACNDAGGRDGLRWVLDPIDGTKGYLRRGQYAIALALMEEGKVTLGVLGCPSLPAGGGELGCLFVAERGRGTVQIPLQASPSTTDEEVLIRTSQIEDAADAAFCESVEAAHSAHERHARIGDLLGVRAEPVRMDSQCKYGVVGRGEAAIYLRLPRDESYREKIWDHAAGWIVVREAGGRVTDVDGKELDFGLGRTLDQNRGIVASNGLLHDQVLDAIERTEPPLGTPR